MREKQALEIIGAIDKDPGKAGKDLSEVVGATDGPWGVPVVTAAREMLAQEPDVVVHTTASYLTSVGAQLVECLEAGASVVSTCEELAYPFRKYPDLSRKLDEVAREAGVALVGTGVNPGFVMDKLVLTLAAVSQNVERARAIRIVDASKRRLPLQRKIGAGMTAEEFRQQVANGVIKHHGLPESVAMVADGLGLQVDDIKESIEPKLAHEQVTTEYLTVEPGQVTGVHQIARGFGGGVERVYMELQMFVGAPESSDTVELFGTPNISLTVPGGTHGDIATASVAVNCIPEILKAPAGLRTSRDLAMCFFAPNATP
jgi:4-hydroxy-tetrahydrodipicolinate reductase